ncbi:MAG: trigger factor [Bacteriovoracaceae bacterium]|jgi:trigger factor|nr:trigger factor [Bacteriovoracaceae bacterium]
MSYTLEQINGCTKKISFNFENVDLTTQIEDALKAKQKDANLKGFRKGKAPMSMVKQAYGPQIENDALYKFVSQEFYKAIQEEKLQAVGYPMFANTKFEDNNISFEATVEIFPEFEVKDYSKYSFTKDDETVTEDDIKDLKSRYLSSKAQMQEVKDETVAIANGHHVVFNFEGEKEDGSKPANMKADEFLLEIGSGQFIPGFEDGMIGLKKGDKKSIDLTFPAEYHEEDLQNAKVTFHVEVLEIKEKNLPELTDELAKEFGFESAEDFETKNKERLESQKKREVQSKLQEEILNKLIEDNDFDVPTALIDQQKKSVENELTQNLKSQGFDDNMVKTYFEKWQSDITSKALFQVKSGLILDKLAKSLEIEASDDDFDAKIEEIAAGSGMEKDQLAGYYKGNEQIKANLMYAIREEKTFTALIDKMKVK